MTKMFVTYKCVHIYYNTITENVLMKQQKCYYYLYTDNV